MPSQKDLSFAEKKGFSVETNPDTGRSMGFWDPSGDRWVVEVWHSLLTFKDPLHANRPQNACDSSML
jgi:hypothetical protein